MMRKKIKQALLYKRGEIALIGRKLQDSMQTQCQAGSSFYPLSGIDRSVHLQLSYEF